MKNDKEWSETGHSERRKWKQRNVSTSSWTKTKEPEYKYTESSSIKGLNDKWKWIVLLLVTNGD